MHEENVWHLVNESNLKWKYELTRKTSIYKRLNVPACGNSSGSEGRWWKNFKRFLCVILMKIKQDQHKSSEWWETTWQKVVFSLGGDAERGEEEQRGPPFTSLFLSFHRSLRPLYHSLLSAPIRLFPSRFHCLQSTKGLVSSQRHVVPRVRKKYKSQWWIFLI